MADANYIRVLEETIIAQAKFIHALMIQTRKRG